MPEMIQATIHLDGRAAEAAGERHLEYALAPPARLGTLLELLEIRRPALAEAMGDCTVLVNGEAADADTPLSSGDHIEIRLDPPT